MRYKQRYFKNLLISSVVIASFAINSCGEKYHLTACFTVDSSNASVGDTLTFTNCSDYDGAPYNNGARWDFGDGVNENSSIEKEITHVYSKAGTYFVEIYIGGAEDGDSDEKTIIIE